jgi:DeoR/GlpR family transcriptional regulator of sugar metabolism
MGVHGMSLDAGFTTPNLLEAETNRALVEASRRLVVVADRTKWGVRGLSRIAELADADTIVSDDGLPHEARTSIAEQGVQLVLSGSRQRLARRAGLSDG